MACVTYANESFYSLYETSAFEIINKRVSEAVPELSFVRDSILSATAVRTRRVKLTPAPEERASSASPTVRL